VVGVACLVVRCHPGSRDLQDVEVEWLEGSVRGLSLARHEFVRRHYDEMGPRAYNFGLRFVNSYDLCERRKGEVGFAQIATRAEVVTAARGLTHQFDSAGAFWAVVSRDLGGGRKQASGDFPVS